MVTAEWVALALGLVAGATTPETQTPLLVAATALGALFVLAHTLRLGQTSVPDSLYLQILVTVGAVLTVGSVTLTGGLGSPFLLLALTPTLLAAAASGLRLGITTSLVTSGLLAAIATTQGGGEALVAGIGALALFPLTAVVVAQIRGLLVEAEARELSLQEASAHTEAEMARLGQTNDLLQRLTHVYGAGTTSPVELGRSALEAVVDAGLANFGTATLFDSRGPVVVARVGTDAPDLVKTQIPLGEGETSSGVVSLATARELTISQRTEIDTLLRPVAVSFANAVLLQEIAETAVREERLRLARELHDEVGPALAALGLSLDATQMHTTDTGLKASLTYAREGLGNVVDDLRGIIADLRAEESVSLVSALHRAVADLIGPPPVSVEIHEHRPPRATAMRQILAIIAEAVRNSHRHSEAAAVRVLGTVDRGLVEIEVVDDGRGYNPGELPEGHYGVLGMRERADRIGAVLDINSAPGRTSVRLVWKEQR